MSNSYKYLNFVEEEVLVFSFDNALLMFANNSAIETLNLSTTNNLSFSELFDIELSLIEKELQENSEGQISNCCSLKIRNGNRDVEIAAKFTIIEQSESKELFVTFTKRKSGQKGILKYERLYYLIQKLHEGVVIHEDNNVVFINKALEEMTGYDVEKLKLDVEWTDLAAPEEKQRLQEIFVDMKQQGISNFEIDFWIITKKGIRKYVHNRYSKHVVNDKEVQYVICQDITSSKQAEITVQKKEHEFEALAENSPNMIAFFNRELRCLYINPAGSKITGLDRSQVVGKTIDVFGFPEKQYKQVKNTLITLFSTHESKTFELKLPTKNGTRYLTVSVIPEEVIDGTMDTVLTISHDITDLKEKELALYESRKRNQAIIDNMIDVVWTLDENYKLEYITPSIRKLSGYSPEEYMQLEYSQLYPPDSLVEINRVIETISHGVKTGNITKINQTYSFQAQLIGSDKQKIWVEIGAQPVFDNDGAFTGIQGVTKDISKRKEAEFALIEAKEKAIEADRLKSAFLANMSHEIRTPMNAIIGFTDLLYEEELEDHKKEEYIKLINNNSTHLLKLIEDIIDISKIEAGELKVEKTDIDINQLLKELYEIHNEKIWHQEKKQIDLRISIPDNEVKLTTDPVRIRQIFTNLLTNSIKFTETGFIEFGFIAHDQDTIRFYVKDTGIGMDEEKLKYIFDRFRQVDENINRNFQGSGLGLAITKQLVELLGGEIWVESDVGQGSIFYFTLPHQWKANVKLEQIIEEGEEELFNVLIVEDEDTNFQLLKEMLKARNYRLFWAKDGQEAIEVADEEDINLVLMDIQLPKIDGYEATRIIKSKQPELPIIAQTAYANYNDVVKSLDAGCNDFIAKPIKRKKLLGMIDKYLHGVEQN